MIRLLDLPGADAIERRLKLNLLTGMRGADHELNEMVDAFKRDVLGIWSQPFGVYGLDDPEDPTSYYDVFYVCPEHVAEMIDIWSKAGWDITAEPGTIALSYEPLATCLVRLVNRTDLDEGEGKTLMELGALAWASRAAPLPKGPTERERARNQAFLTLGAKRVRAA